MKRYGMGVVVLLVLSLGVAGCNKKSTDQASLTSSPTGFDSLTTEELVQLPQVSAASSQQSAIEVLPVETSPVTQTASASFTPGNEVAAPSETGSNASAEGGSASGGKDSPEHNKKIQIALKNLSLYNGNIDGKLGPASLKAIEAFQKNNGLKVDGKVGSKTWAALEPYLNGPATAAPTETKGT